MLEFIILMIVIDLLCKIKFGRKVEEKAELNPYDNGTPDVAMLKSAWEFDNIDDAMDFRELRRSGWRGNAQDFYKLREKGEI